VCVQHRFFLLARGLPIACCSLAPAALIRSTAVSTVALFARVLQQAALRCAAACISPPVNALHTLYFVTDPSCSTTHPLSPRAGTATSASHTLPDKVEKPKAQYTITPAQTGLSQSSISQRLTIILPITHKQRPPSTHHDSTVAVSTRHAETTHICQQASAAATSNRATAETMHICQHASAAPSNRATATMQHTLHSFLPDPFTQLSARGCDSSQGNNKR
jgi:hypothetical protein